MFHDPIKIFSMSPFEVAKMMGFICQNKPRFFRVNQPQRSQKYEYIQHTYRMIRVTKRRDTASRSSIATMHTSPCADEVEDMTAASSHSTSSALRTRLASFLAEQHAHTSPLHSVQCRVRASVSIIRKALRCYSFPEEIALSYNGGKDCLVMLVLLSACLNGLRSAEEDEEGGEELDEEEKRRQQRDGQVNSGEKNAQPEGEGEGARSAHEINNSNEHQHQHQHSHPHGTQQSCLPISTIYAQPPDPFPAVESFVSSSAATYNLDVTRLPTVPPNSSLRSVFATYLASHPRIQAIFVGTRRSDPYGAELRPFHPTDCGWPDFMRIHPILDWHYSDIWTFLRHMDVNYCPLYDQGYTSLGDASNTQPNPHLEVQNQGQDAVPASAAYLPAYELKSDEEERLGRE